MDESCVTYHIKDKLQARLWQLLIYATDIVDAAVGIVTLASYNPWLAMRLRFWVMKNAVRKSRQRRIAQGTKYVQS